MKIIIDDELKTELHQRVKDARNDGVVDSELTDVEVLLELAKNADRKAREKTSGISDLSRHAAFYYVDYADELKADAVLYRAYAKELVRSDSKETEEESFDSE